MFSDSGDRIAKTQIEQLQGKGTRSNEWKKISFLMIIIDYSGIKDELF